MNHIQYDGSIRRSVRCRSHLAYNATLDFTRLIISQEDCSFANSLDCDCTTCPTRKSIETTTVADVIKHKTRKPKLKSTEKEILWPKRLPIPTYFNKSSDINPKADSIYSNHNLYDQENSSSNVYFFNFLILVIFIIFHDYL